MKSSPNPPDATATLDALPRHMWQLSLYGAGLDQLRLERRPLPVPGDDDLLARTDCVGLCASDVKIAIQGPNHPRLRGVDLARDPVVLGHEVAATVVHVGRRSRHHFQSGDRITVQADIHEDGQDVFYGYRRPGALRQYQLIDRHMIDEGHVLPVPPKLAHAEAALAEPWACVLTAYERHRPTRSVLPGGTTWVIGAGPMALMHVEKALADGAATVAVSDLRADRLEKLRNTFASPDDPHDLPGAQQGPTAANAENPADRRARASAGRGRLVLIDLTTDAPERHLKERSVDDCILCCPSVDALAAALPFLARGAFINIFAGFPAHEPPTLTLNLNDLHYHRWTLTGTSGSSIPALRQALQLIEAGRLHPSSAVAAVGGLGAACDSLRAVAEARYPGRIVLYPQLDLPLTDVRALSADGRWSAQAEARLLAHTKLARA